MNVQIITTPAGEQLVLLPKAEYEAILAAAEDNADRSALADFRSRLASGEEELLPAEIVDRLLSGENRLRVWREHRGLTVRSLAERAGIAQPYLSQIETGRREGTVETYRKLAAALSLGLDDLLG